MPKEAANAGLQLWNAAARLYRLGNFKNQQISHFTTVSHELHESPLITKGGTIASVLL